MKKFAVTISAKVTKTLEVEAANEDEAVEIAHRDFIIEYEVGQEERYDQWLEECEELTVK